MKKILCNLLVIALLLSLYTGYVSASDMADETDYPEWEMLSEHGLITVSETGEETVTIIFPAEFFEGNLVTQSELDEDGGEHFIAATVNEDDTITYVMTKEQHKASITEMSESIEKALKEMIESVDYSFRSIEHNEDFSVYNIYLNTSELGRAEAYSTIGFTMYSMFYGTFLCRNIVDNVIMNYYDNADNLIATFNSTDILL